MSSGTVIIIILLSFQVLPVALGVGHKKEAAKSAWFGLILILGQLLMFNAGYYLGGRFMHLLNNYTGTVIFAGFFIIGVRYIMDSFRIRKGERTFVADNSSTVFLASLAQGINTFLAGILISSMIEKTGQLNLVLLLSTFLMVAAGILLNPSRQSFIFISFLYLTSGLFLIFGSVYLGFFV